LRELKLRFSAGGHLSIVSSGNSVATGASIGTGLSMDNSLHYFSSQNLTNPGCTGRFLLKCGAAGGYGFSKERLDLFTKGQERDKFLTAALEKNNSGQGSQTKCRNTSKFWATNAEQPLGAAGL